MEWYTDLTRKTFLVIMILCLTVSVNAKVNEVIWQKEFEAGGGLSYSPGAAVFDYTDSKLLIVGTSFHPKAYSQGKLKLWEIDLDGKMTKDKNLGQIEKNSISYVQLASRMIKGLSVSKSRKIKAAGIFHGHGKAIMSMDRKGDSSSIKSITETSVIGDDDIIYKKIDLPNDNSLLLGKNNRDDGLIIKIDSDGRKLWEKTYGLGKLEYFTDGVSVGNNGDFIVVGASATLIGQMEIGKDSSVWVLRCDSQGEILSSIVFPGNPFVKRMPQICQISSGEIIVAYDKFYPNGLTLKALTVDLSELWQKKAFNNENAVFDFKIKAIPARGFIVAFGIGYTGLGVHEYSETGSEISQISWENVVRGGNFLLEVTADKAFVILQTRARDAERITRLKVIALKVSK